MAFIKQSQSLWTDHGILPLGDAALALEMVSWLCWFLAVWPQMRCFAPLILSFLSCQMGRMPPPGKAVVRNKCDAISHVLYDCLTVRQSPFVQPGFKPMYFLRAGLRFATFTI